MILLYRVFCGVTLVLYQTNISHLYDTESNTDLQRESKRIKTDSIDQTYRWHLRLGHSGLERIKRLVKEGPLESLQVGSLPTCESCLEEVGRAHV